METAIKSQSLLALELFELTDHRLMAEGELLRIAILWGRYTMIYFKCCPRCQGDMNTCWDQYGKYFQCLQCGFIPYPQNAIVTQEGKARKPSRSKATRLTSMAARDSAKSTPGSAALKWQRLPC
jgi:hypothetical protein